jgi:hypothetical protein
VEETIVTVATWLLKWTFLLTWEVIRRSVRGAAQLSARLLPQPKTQPEAVAYAALAGGVWWLLVTGVFGLLGGKDGLGYGALAGLVVGIAVTVAIAKRNRAFAQTAAGGISLGQSKGSLGVNTPHVIDRASRVRHVSVFGATGSGKSTAIKNLVAQDLQAPDRPGLMVVDIKDDLVLDIAARVPADRLQDVILFDPADTAFPPAFNPLADVPEESRTLAAAELVAALKRLYADAWGPRLEHVFRHVVLTLLETPDATLLDISRLLTDPDYRAWAVDHGSNPMVTAFWEREFPSIVGRSGSLANVESLLNKLSIFVYPEIRNVVGQPRPGLNFRRAMDQGKILLFNLPQGKLGEDASSFLAALVVGKAQLAAQSRVALPHAARKPFYLFVDEFQNYETSAFDKLVTEGRSMGIGIVASCQYPEQLAAELRLSLQKNCAYSLFCHVEDGKHRIKVIKQQEPNAVDAVTVLQATPPPRVADDGRLDQLRVQARLTVGHARSAVERGILQRLQPDGAADTNADASETTEDTPPRNTTRRTKRLTSDDADAV